MGKSQSRELLQVTVARSEIERKRERGERVIASNRSNHKVACGYIHLCMMWTWRNKLNFNQSGLFSYINRMRQIKGNAFCVKTLLFYYKHPAWNLVHKWRQMDVDLNDYWSDGILNRYFIHELLSYFIHSL